MGTRRQRASWTRPRARPTRSCGTSISFQDEVTEKQMSEETTARKILNARLKKPKKHKYNVGPKAKRVADGICFDSIKEKAHFLKLKKLSKDGEIRLFLRQPAFDLPGPSKFHADFQVIWADGRVAFQDVKSKATKNETSYRLRKRQVEALYNVEIEEV